MFFGRISCAAPGVLLSLMLAVVGSGRNAASLEKVPVPSEHAREAGKRLVWEAYEEELGQAATAAQKLTLAGKLRRKADEAQSELAVRYALYCEAWRLAVEGGDVVVALDVVDATAETFQFDVLMAKGTTVARVNESARATAQRTALVKAALELIDRFLVEDNYAAANRLAEIAMDSARKTADREMAERIAVIAGTIREAANEYAVIQGALEKSPTGPTDPQIGLAASRSDVFRDVLVRRRGGNLASERSVEMGLKWLAVHQMPDGGWSFDHRFATACQGKCGDPGKETQARRGATAMALLPFLGAGQTHKQGKYKDTVQAGFNFLTRSMKFESGKPGGSLFDQPGGRMYSHGLGAIAMCELFAMTHDKNYHAPAQAAIDFIVYAQDPVGGGWRYQPRQKGDTSVFGWQITALMIGRQAGLDVPSVTLQKAESYLDSVQSHGGANYGYTSPGEGPATTAIGLLCRMHLGWKNDNPALQRGVQWLSAQGPSKINMYYNYYATQVMRHYGGEDWKKWNAVMRDQLVESQATAGHQTGSWYIANAYSSFGGRLYCTSLAVLILESYYRYPSVFGIETQDRE